MAFLLRILPDLSTSATDSGIFLLSVSGSMSEERPAVTEKRPKMITGMAAWMSPCPSLDLNYVYSKLRIICA